MSNPIKIWFSDFWVPFTFNEPYFTPLLKKHFNITLDPKPDVLIHSVFGKSYLKYNCTRVCYTGENVRPDFTRSDYHIGFDYLEDPRYLRWPNFLRYYNPDQFLERGDAGELLKKKTRFCAFLISNDKAEERIRLFQHLSEYRKVDSGGKALNNIGFAVENKVQFIQDYKFTIAYENCSYPGYTTEKIYEPFLVHSVPLYWGNPRINEDFNPKAFICAHNFSSEKELIEYIRYVDQNDEVYKKYLEEPCFSNNKVPEDFKQAKILSFFEHIFRNLNKIKIVSKRTDYFLFYKYKIGNMVNQLNF
jgi:alpha(1,3/1,4) fucosyltransferase